MSMILPFKENPQITMGVELELQLIDLHSFNLTMESRDLMRRLSQIAHPGEIKPEITQGMIEINSSIHTSYHSLLKELYLLRNIIAKEAYQTHIGVCGGGAHPFQKWNEQRIYPSERFASLSEQYGYLAQQFTVFGQHIHIACANGDDALYLCHAFTRYIPHFIALSAASPFHQGIDTAFDCSRLAVINAFPLSGVPPWITQWEEFSSYYQKMTKLKIIKSMKDFYWDIRPKPEYGTMEIRISDTPLTVDKAAQLAAYAQMLARYLLTHRPPCSQDIYLAYFTNRFRASRYGFDAELIDPLQDTHTPISEDILLTCKHLENHAADLESTEALNLIRNSVRNHDNDAKWLRSCYKELDSLHDVVRAQIQLWKGEISRFPKITNPMATDHLALHPN
ncbi:MAG: glutamate--cysteine ligase [Proteobacteria bacterium]|nr:glutamate--cysteine ligase [Pseudomonadota bacterium]